jgi:hypothetical protein
MVFSQAIRCAPNIISISELRADVEQKAKANASKSQGFNRRAATRHFSIPGGPWAKVHGYLQINGPQ